MKIEVYNASTGERRYYSSTNYRPNGSEVIVYAGMWKNGTLDIHVVDNETAKHYPFDNTSTDKKEIEANV